MSKNLTKKGKNTRSLLTSGERLKEWRKKRGLTQAELSDKVYCTDKYISMIERNDREISKSLLPLLGEVLRVNPDYLTCKSENPYPYENTVFSSTCYEKSDYAFLAYLSFKYDIILCIEDSDPDITDEMQLRINQVYNIDFSVCTCVYAIDKGLESERIRNAVIKSVIINGKKYEYGQFTFIINEIQRDIDYKINSIGSILDSYERNVIQKEIEINDILENKELYNIAPKHIIEDLKKQ